MQSLHILRPSMFLDASVYGKFRGMCCALCIFASLISVKWLHLVKETFFHRNKNKESDYVTALSASFNAFCSSLYSCFRCVVTWSNQGQEQVKGGKPSYLNLSERFLDNASLRVSLIFASVRFYVALSFFAVNLHFSRRIYTPKD